MSDLPDALSKQLQETPDGLRYRIQLQSVEALALMTTFGWVGAAVLIIPSILLIVFNPGCCIFILIGLVLIVAAPLLGTRMTKEVWVDITPEGLRQNAIGGVQKTWKRFDGLVLSGDVGRRDAKLMAGKFEILSWKAVQVDAEQGWDVERIRWFAQRVAAISGLTLEDALPSLEAFSERVAEKQEESRLRRLKKREREQQKNQERFPELHATLPEPAQTRTIEGGVAFVLDQGERFRRAKETSTTEEQPVYLDGDVLVVGRRCEALVDFEDFYVWFETDEDRVDVLLGGDLRSGKSWKLARRESRAAGQMLGVAQALRSKLA